MKVEMEGVDVGRRAHQQTHEIGVTNRNREHSHRETAHQNQQAPAGVLLLSIDVLKRVKKRLLG